MRSQDSSKGAKSWNSKGQSRSNSRKKLSKTIENSTIEYNDDYSLILKEP
jgi:hypothetical protein